MTKTYIVETYGQATFTVTLDESGVVDADLLPDAIERLKFAVARNMRKRGLSPISSLVQAVGSYSSVREFSPSDTSASPEDDLGA